MPKHLHNRGKAARLYIERKIIKHGKLEDMSEQELEAKMKQILDDYAPILNVTPKTDKITNKISEKLPALEKKEATSNTNSSKESKPELDLLKQDQSE